jgi:hypothetical protein
VVVAVKADRTKRIQNTQRTKSSSEKEKGRNDCDACCVLGEKLPNKRSFLRNLFIKKWMDDDVGVHNSMVPVGVEGRSNVSVVEDKKVVCQGPKGLGL